MEDEVKTRTVKVIGRLRTLQGEYLVIRQETLRGFASNVTGWTVVVVGSEFAGVYPPPLFVAATGWSLEYYSESKEITIEDTLNDLMMAIDFDTNVEPPVEPPDLTNAEWQHTLNGESLNENAQD